MVVVMWKIEVSDSNNHWKTKGRKKNGERENK